MNKDNMNTLIDRLKNLPENCGFDMSFHAFNRHFSKHGCGSACCIGGHAALLMGEQLLSATAALMRYLDVSEDTANKLAYAYELPFDDITVDMAVETLEHLRDTYTVDWLVSDAAKAVVAANA